MSAKLEYARNIISHHMTTILEMFKPGAKIAVVVWYRDSTEKETVLMSPDVMPDEILAVMERMKGRDRDE